MSGQKLVTSKEYPHLGGNILQGDFATWEPTLWRWLKKIWMIETVLDVGCGRGFSTRWFREHGCIAIGLDGLPDNIVATGSPAMLVDLSLPLPPLPVVDLVWCCEVVEHVEEKHLHQLIQTLSMGDFAAITHAGVGQGGWHHVNCKPAQYWIDAMKAGGMTYLSEKTKVGKSLCNPGHHFAQRGLIFARDI